MLRQWLAILRIVVGLYFVKSLVTKMSIVLLGGFLPLPAASERWINVMPTIVTKQASDNPILFYKHFLENTVLTHGSLFAHLTAWGETVVGLGLTLGFLTGLASHRGTFPGHQLRPGDAVDVARAAGVPPAAHPPDDHLLRFPCRADLGSRRPARREQTQVAAHSAAAQLNGRLRLSG